MNKDMKRKIIDIINIKLQKYNRKIKWCKVKQIQDYAFGKRYVIKSIFPFCKLLVYESKDMIYNDEFQIYLLKGYLGIKL